AELAPPLGDAPTRVGGACSAPRRRTDSCGRRLLRPQATHRLVWAALAPPPGVAPTRRGGACSAPELSRIRREPKTQTEPAIVLRVRVAQPAARAVGVEVPAAAADDALLAGCGAVRVGVLRTGVAVRSVPIRRPLPHVAVHVAEAPRVQRERPDGRR